MTEMIKPFEQTSLGYHQNWEYSWLGHCIDLALAPPGQIGQTGSNIVENVYNNQRQNSRCIVTVLTVFICSVKTILWTIPKQWATEEDRILNLVRNRPGLHILCVSSDWGSKGCLIPWNQQFAKSVFRVVPTEKGLISSWQPLEVENTLTIVSGIWKPNSLSFPTKIYTGQGAG